MQTNLKFAVILIAILVVNIIGFYFPPTSILASPLLVGLITFLLLYTGINVSYRIIAITIAIIVNDLCIKSFAGGTHDIEGAGFINAFLILSVIISAMIILFKVMFMEHISWGMKALLILIQPLVMIFHIQCFRFFGVSYTVPISSTKEQSIAKNVYLTDLDFSRHEIVYQSDSIRILSGWAEKQLLENHTTLFSETDETNRINFKINLIHNLKPNDHSVYYKINSDDINGSQRLDSVLSCSSIKSDTIVLRVFKLRYNEAIRDTIIGSVVVKLKLPI
jgi:hypothetical protein